MVSVSPPATVKLLGSASFDGFALTSQPAGASGTDTLKLRSAAVSLCRVTLNVVLVPTVPAFAWTLVSMVTPLPSTVDTVSVSGSWAVPSGAFALTVRLYAWGVAVSGTSTRSFRSFGAGLAVSLDGVV